MCDAVKDDKFTRVGRKGDDLELIPGLLGSGRWRRLKGGITMDSGCSIDTVPSGHAPNVTLGPIPLNRANRRINAANGTRIKEYIWREATWIQDPKGDTVLDYPELEHEDAREQGEGRACKGRGHEAFGVLLQDLHAPD